ncbi:NUDIX hydrolase [candidate division KSB1 bacterium]|nr:MAG: NUDIX hydrolase [candidate division KSB1 bacterium]
MKEKIFCPYCGTRFIKKLEKRKRRLYCSNCEQFFYDNPIPGVVAIVPDKKNDKIVLIKRKVIPRAGFWALPGGFIDKNENAQKAIFRELSEETGLKPDSLELMDTLYRNSKVYGPIVVICFVVNSYNGVIKAGDDALEVDFFSLDNLPSLAFHSHKKFIDIYKSKRISQNRF